MTEGEPVGKAGQDGGVARASDRAPTVVFVGAGMVAELHQRAIAVGGHLRLGGVFDPQEDLAQRRALSWGCRRYENLEQALCDPNIEAVLVLSPPATHAEITLASLRAGKHVLVEKPVSRHDKVVGIGREAGRRGLVCMPGHNYAYQPEFQSLRRLVRDGKLGSPRAAWLTYVVRHPESVARAYGNVLEEVMVHHTYLALALFGVPSTIYAGCMEPAWEEHTAEDQAWMTWHYPGGLSVHHFATFAVDDHTSSPWLFGVKVLAEKGSSAYNWHDSVFHRPLGTLPFAVPAYEDSYVHEHAAFAAAIAGDTGAVVSSLDDAAVAAQLLVLAREASNRGVAAHVAPGSVGGN